MTDDSAGEVYRIGSVSRLTGLSTHTLRKWETRYGTVVPGRTAGGERFYTRDDLDRLTLMKRLVDSGVAASDVARLSRAELARRAAQLDAVASAAGTRAARPVRAAVVGDAVAAMFDRSAATANAVEVVARARVVADLDATSAAGSIDVVLYECPAVNADTRRAVEALRARMGAAAAVVVYGFGARADLQALHAGRLAAVRMPADLRTLEQTVTRLVDLRTPPVTAVPAARSADVPAPRLSRETLARLARSTPAIRCECPHHLADILLSLRAFEEYSLACESSSPEDAALHHYLWRSAAQARAVFEDAVERVAEAEGIPLEA